MKNNTAIQNIALYIPEEERVFFEKNIIKFATNLKNKFGDFGIKTDTYESARKYLDIFHNFIV